MNRLTKKIRKPNRRQNPNAPQAALDIDEIALIDATDDASLEVLTASFANLQSWIEEPRFYEIVRGEVIKKLIDCLRHSNPQIVVNSLYAMQTLFRVSSSYESKLFEQMCLSLNLLAAIEQVQSEVCQAQQLVAKNPNLPHVTCALLSFLTEFFEVCTQPTLKKVAASNLFNGTLNLIVQVLQKPLSEEVYIQLFNYLQILSESVPKVNDLVAQSKGLLLQLTMIFEGNFADNEVFESSSFSYKQKLQSLLIIVIFNVLLSSSQQNNDSYQTLLETFKRSFGTLLNNVLTVNIFKEVENLKQLIVTGNLLPQIEKVSQDSEIQEEEPKIESVSINLDDDRKVKNALSIWLDTADSIIEQLKFLARLYEGVDYADDVEIEEEVDTQQQQRGADENVVKLLPTFFDGTCQKQLVALLFSNFFSLAPLIAQNDFIQRVQGYKLALYIREASIMIVNAALGAIQNILQLAPFDPQVLKDLISGAHAQLQLILTTDSVILDDKEDKAELLDTYLKCYIILLQKDTTVIPTLPEPALLQLAQQIFSQTIGGDVLLHTIELLKLRYNSKIVNSLETIAALTEMLLGIIGKGDPLLAAQALDCLFDVYTEEDYNIILKEKQILALLQKGHEYMKPIIATLKGKLPSENLKFVRVTHTNLRDFIEYKRKIMGPH